jgi:hypothetical protein
MKVRYYTLFLLCIFCACQDNKNISLTNENDFFVQTIQWKMKKDFQIKDIVENIQYIMLEDNENSLFSAIDKLIIKGNRIYLLDITGPKSLLVFDMTGKFLHKIGRQGNGPGEYANSLINFDVLDNDIVLLYDYAKRKMMFYDENGKYVKSVRSTFSFNDFYMLQGNNYLLSMDIYEKRNKNRKIILTQDLNHIDYSLFFFSDDYKNDKLNIRTFQPYKNNIAYMCPISDTLFVFDKQGIVNHAYFFDFGKKKLPENLKNSYEETIIQRKKGNYYSYIYITPVIVNQYIFANMFIEDQKYIAVFDCENNTLTYELLSPDNFSIENINFPLCAMNDSLIVSYIDSNLYDDIKDRFSVNSEIDNHLLNGGAIICLNKIK